MLSPKNPNDRGLKCFPEESHLQAKVVLVTRVVITCTYGASFGKKSKEEPWHMELYREVF